MLMGKRPTNLQLRGSYDAWLHQSRCSLARLLTTLTPRDRQPSPGCSPGCEENIKLRTFGCHERKMSTSSTDLAKPGVDGLSEVPFDILYQQCLKLPSELCSMIMKMIFEDVFGPRKVYPHQESKRDQEAGRLFLSLDKDMYRRNFEIYWSTSTWVIGSGPVSKTMRFMSKGFPMSRVEYSRQEPCRAALNIQSMELCFSYEDATDHADWDAVLQSDQGNPDTKDFQNCVWSTDAGQFFRRHPEQFKAVALRQWQDKFDRVAVLNLRHLTLDMTKAMVPPDSPAAPAGEYLGLKAVELLIPFVHGLPTDFKILARTQEEEAQMRQIFEAKNL